MSSYETSSGIVAGIQQGDKNAETAFVQKYRQVLAFVLEKRIGDREKAQDLAQEALLIVLQKLRRDSIKEPAKLSAYIHNTAINLYIGEIRKETRHNTRTDSDFIATCADTEGDQYLALLNERAGAAVAGLIQELNNYRDREILTLYYLEEREKGEICEKLDLSDRHFDRVISRARKRFRELLEERQNEIPLELTV